MEQAAIFAKIEDLLVTCIPHRVMQLRIREPVYSLRIWYYGSDLAGDRTPTLMITTDVLRRKIIGERASLAPNYLWGADELDHIEGVYHCELVEPELSALCNAWYQNIESGAALPPGREELLPFRQMAQRVATRLNQFDWKKCLRPTADFVVFAADGSHEFCDDFGEMVASVAPSQIDDFRARRLLGADPWWKLGSDDA